MCIAGGENPFQVNEVGEVGENDGKLLGSCLLLLLQLLEMLPLFSQLKAPKHQNTKTRPITKVLIKDFVSGVRFIFTENCGHTAHPATCLGATLNARGTKMGAKWEQKWAGAIWEQKGSNMGAKWAGARAEAERQPMHPSVMKLQGSVMGQS